MSVWFGGIWLSTSVETADECAFWKKELRLKGPTLLFKCRWVVTAPSANLRNLCSFLFKRSWSPYSVLEIASYWQDALDVEVVLKIADVTGRGGNYFGPNYVFGLRRKFLHNIFCSKIDCTFECIPIGLHRICTYMVSFGMTLNSSLQANLAATQRDMRGRQ